MTRRGVHVRGVHVPGSRCRTCGVENDGAASRRDSDMVGVRPEPGDAGICLYCGTISLYDGSLGLRPPTVKEEKDILSDPEVALMVRDFSAKWGGGH